MRLLFFAGAVFLFMAGCGSGTDRDIVARAGKLSLSRDEVNASIEYSSSRDSLTMSAVYIEDWKDLASLYQLALENGINEGPEVRLLIEKALRQRIESIDAGYAAGNRQAHGNSRQFRPLRRIHAENEKIKEVLQNLSPGELSPVLRVHDSLFVVIEMHDIVKKGDKKSFVQAYGEVEELLIVQKQKQYYSTLLEEARQKYQ